MARQFGKSIAGVPFRLLRREEAVPKKIEGKLVASTSYVVHLDVDTEWGSKALKVIAHLALPEIVEGEVAEFPQIESGETFPDEDLHPMTYDEASQTIITTKNGAERFMSELTADQLNRTIKNGTPQLAEAAKVILKHDFNLEPEIA